MGLFDLFSSSNEKKAAKKQKEGLDLGRSTAFGDLSTGEADLRSQYGSAGGYFEPLAETYGLGSRLYGDALGLYGDEGTARAREAFTTGPGYDFAMDQGTQAVLRNASATGALGGGQTSIDLTRFAQGLANQEYDGWLDRIGGYDDKAMETARARAGIDVGLGDQLLGLSRDRAGIDWSTETGKGQADANYQLSKDQTGANIFNAITGGLSLGAKLLGVGGFAPPAGA